MSEVIDNRLLMARTIGRVKRRYEPNSVVEVSQHA